MNISCCIHGPSWATTRSMLADCICCGGLPTHPPCPIVGQAACRGSSRGHEARPPCDSGPPPGCSGKLLRGNRRPKWHSMRSKAGERVTPHWSTRNGPAVGGGVGPRAKGGESKVAARVAAKVARVAGRRSEVGPCSVVAQTSWRKQAPRTSVCAHLFASTIELLCNRAMASSATTGKKRRRVSLARVTHKAGPVAGRAVGKGWTASVAGGCCLHSPRCRPGPRNEQNRSRGSAPCQACVAAARSQLRRKRRTPARQGTAVRP